MQPRTIADGRHSRLRRLDRFVWAALSLLVAGVAAMFIIVQVTRLFGLLQPLSDFGMLKLDLLQAVVWGCLVALIGTPFLLRGTRVAIVLMVACLLATQGLLVMAVLYYLGALNSTVASDAHLELYPTAALVPLTVGLAMAFKRVSLSQWAGE